MAKLSSSRWFLAALIYCIFIVLPADAHKEHGPKEISKLSISNENGMTHIIRRQLPNRNVEFNDDDYNNRIEAGDSNFVFDEALPKEFPWMVSIEVSFVKYYQCSPTSNAAYRFAMVTNGILISDQWILTSASGLYWNGDATITPCGDADYEVTYKNPLINEATITLGALNMSNSFPVVPSEPQRVVIDSRLIILHPEFNFEEEAQKLSVDLALIKLPIPIEFDEFISPITISSGVGVGSMDELTMVSYGYLVNPPALFTGDQGMGRSELRKAVVRKAQSNGECQPTFPFGHLNESYVACVSGLGYAYWGDQGAAMVYSDGNEQSNWTIAAVASKHNYNDRYKEPSAGTNGYSVAVKVEPHLGWINSIINDDSFTQPPDYTPTTLYPTGGAAGSLVKNPGLSRMVVLTTVPLLLLLRGSIYF